MKRRVYPVCEESNFVFETRQSSEGTCWITRPKFLRPAGMGLVLFFVFPPLMVLLMLPSFRPAYVKIACQNEVCQYQKVNLSPFGIGQNTRKEIPVQQIKSSQLVEVPAGEDTIDLWQVSLPSETLHIDQGEALEPFAEGLQEYLNASPRTDFYFQQWNAPFFMAQILSVLFLLGIFFFILQMIRRRPMVAVASCFSKDELVQKKYNVWGKGREIQRIALADIKDMHSVDKEDGRFVLHVSLSSGQSLALHAPLHIRNFGATPAAGEKHLRELIDALPLKSIKVNV